MSSVQCLREGLGVRVWIGSYFFICFISQQLLCYIGTLRHPSFNSSEKTNKLSQPTDKSPTKTCFRIWWLPLKAMLSSSCVSYHVEHHRNRKYLLTYLLHRIEPAHSQASAEYMMMGTQTYLSWERSAPFPIKAKPCFYQALSIYN